MEVRKGPCQELGRLCKILGFNEGSGGWIPTAELVLLFHLLGARTRSKWQGTWDLHLETTCFKGFHKSCSKRRKKEGEKTRGRKDLIMGGWERTTKGHCRLFLTWRNNIFSCQGQTLIIIAKTCLPSAYESSRYWIVLSGQDLGEDNRGIEYALNAPHTPSLVLLVL